MKIFSEENLNSALKTTLKRSKNQRLKELELIILKLTKTQLHLWPINLCQKRQDYKMEERQVSSVNAAGKLDSHM